MAYRSLADVELQRNNALRELANIDEQIAQLAHNHANNGLLARRAELWDAAVGWATIVTSFKGADSQPDVAI